MCMRAGIVMGLLAAILWSGTVSAQNSYDIVAASVHNLAGPGAPISKVCGGCHVASGNANPDQLAATPAWAVGTTGSGFSVGTPGSGEFSNTTQTCLQCHDGTTATGIQRAGTAAVQGKAGKKHLSHPVEMLYPRNSAGDFIINTDLPQQRQFWSVPNIVNDALLIPSGPVSSYQPVAKNAVADDLLFSAVRTRDGKVQCESCHNPHDDTIRPFLRATPPQLCLVCHDK